MAKRREGIEIEREPGLWAGRDRLRMDSMSREPHNSPIVVQKTLGSGIARLVSVGSFLPPRCVSSETLEQQLDLPSGWMERRTGVRNRRWVEADMAVSDLAVPAGMAAIGQLPESLRGRIGTLILATSTPDHLLPPTAPYVASQLGLRGIGAFDLAAACSGFLYGLEVARSLVAASSSAVLLIAANVLSKRIRPGDPATTALFADAAGAVVLAPESEVDATFGAQVGGMPSARIVDVVVSSDGRGWNQLWIPSGGSRQPVTPDLLAAGSHLMQIDDGKAVFRYAVEAMAEMSETVLDRNGWTIEDVDVWIPHQANTRIIRALAERLNLSIDKAVVTLPEVGNSSAATIPVALDYWMRGGDSKKRTIAGSAVSDRESTFRSGQQGGSHSIEPSVNLPSLEGKRVLLMAAGAGLTAGAALLEF